MVPVLAGLYGLTTSKGNWAAGGILAGATLLLLTFWRNVWISWGRPASLPDAVPAAEPKPTEGAKGSGVLERVIGVVILIALVALVRACGADIMEAIL